MSEPLGEVGANFSLQLSSRTQFTKINNKKVIAENQCEKYKKSSLDHYIFLGGILWYNILDDLCNISGNMRQKILNNETQPPLH